MIYYFVEQRGGRSERKWFVWNSEMSYYVTDARAYRKQVLDEKLATEVRIIRVDTKAMTARVVK